MFVVMNIVSIIRILLLFVSDARSWAGIFLMGLFFFF